MTAGPSPSPESLAILDRAACGLMQTADDGTFRRANAMFCNWLGYPADELVGKRRLQDLLTIGGRLFHQTHWSPLLRMQGSVSEVKLELVHRTGSLIPMVMNAIRHDEGGVLVHEVAAYVARDRDRYEQELLKSRRRLEALVEEANQLQALANDRALFAEQMIGIVSHDLRNPLSTIRMGTDLFPRIEPAEHPRLLGQIERALDHADNLIADLLDFTQARLGGGLYVAPSRADLHKAVAEILEGLRVAYPRRQLSHRPSGSGEVAVDVGRLGQVIGNLVSNAVSYGDPTSPITVESSVSEQTLTVSVTNAGEPIEPALIGTLFQPMTRGTTAGSKLRSVGLGLFIVQQIAKAHGGAASVHSTKQDGTTFKVVLPRIAAQCAVID